MRDARIIAAMLLAAVAALAGCGGQEGLPDDERTAAADRAVRRRWGKPLAELPVLTLEVISPHNQDIKNEFTWAFSLHHAVEFGSRVDISWRDVGGGGTSIGDYLTAVYKQSDASGIDVLWGGGEYVFNPLARAGVLEKLDLPPDVPTNVPVTLGGMEMIDAERRWIGSAVSGFGFMYNRGMLAACGVRPPEKWADLADARFADVLALADPTQSGSAAMAYYMIVVSEPDWQRGWAKLLGVLANARQFYDSAGAAANAPVLGEALVATCIDFYGIIRVAEAPDELAYVSPPGETTFGCDPIGILKNPPHPELARRLVDFVMSPRGQALWALAVGAPDGPVRSMLGRQPIRKDVYDLYADRFGAHVVNPYRTGQALQIAPEMARVHFGVLRSLVAVAGVDNVNALRAARARLAVTPFEAWRLEEFNRLPDNVDTPDKTVRIAAEMKDPKAADRILSGWRQFFRDKYAKVAQ